MLVLEAAIILLSVLHRIIVHTREVGDGGGIIAMPLLCPLPCSPSPRPSRPGSCVVWKSHCFYFFTGLNAAMLLSLIRLPHCRTILLCRFLSSDAELPRLPNELQGSSECGLLQGSEQRRLQPHHLHLQADILSARISQRVAAAGSPPAVWRLPRPPTANPAIPSPTVACKSTLYLFSPISNPAHKHAVQESKPSSRCVCSNWT